MNDFKPSQVILTFMATAVAAIGWVMQLAARALWFAGTSINRMVLGTLPSDNESTT